MFCTNCGTEKESGMDSCANCGTATAPQQVATEKSKSRKKLYFIAGACALGVVAVLVIVFFVFIRNNLERELLGSWMMTGYYNADGGFSEHGRGIVLIFQENGTFFQRVGTGWSKGSWEMDGRSMQRERMSHVHHVLPRISDGRLYLDDPERGRTEVFTLTSTNTGSNQFDSFVGEWVNPGNDFYFHLYLSASGIGEHSSRREGGQAHNIHVASWEFANNYIIISFADTLWHGYIVDDVYLVTFVVRDDGTQFFGATYQRP